MRIGVPKENEQGEKRVALTPDVAIKMQKLGFTVAIESGAGEEASFSDDEFVKAGVEVVSDPHELWQNSDIILKVRPPKAHPELGFYGLELMKKEYHIKEGGYQILNYFE